jgi:uncharacterized protein YidB (DUF937 family)
MGWSDSLSGNLKGALGGAIGDLVSKAEQAGVPALINEVLGPDGLQKLLAKLKEAGLGPQVSSWLDKTRDNLPVSAEQIRTALGDARVQEIAKNLGIPMDKVTAALAKYLPVAVNEASGGGAAPPAA